jgi:hypothetical protein
MVPAKITELIWEDASMLFPQLIVVFLLVRMTINVYAPVVIQERVFIAEEWTH